MNGLLQMQVNKHIRENNGPITTQELMMLASNVDHCQVLADVNTDEALGKFYVENGFREDLDALPDSAYALLDYAKIGNRCARVKPVCSRRTATLSARRNWSRCRSMSHSGTSIT